MSELNRLKQSRKKKADMLNYFGFIPLSILKTKNPQIRILDMFNYQYETGTSTSAHRIKVESENVKRGKPKKYKEFTWSGKGIGQGRGTLTIMAPQLVDFFIKFYAKKTNLYFDPFAGQGVQLQVANLRGIDYIGYDICKEYIDYIKKFIPKLKKKSKILEIYFRDSKKVHLKNNSVDFCFTSPPYWDTEFYDEHPDQLGINKTYKQFLDGMKQVAKELHRVFKETGYCIINVNDFRKSGQFYAYHNDVINIYKEVGWKVHDVWILDQVVSGFSKIFAGQKITQKIAPKVHEYAIVFKK